MTSPSTARVDMHCHSTASELGKLGIQRSVGLPECATPPEEVYELAKRRGMDFVTITDHDTIAGCLELTERARRVRLRGADHLVQGRAPGGPRPLLRDHIRRPRVPPGARARSRDLRGLPERAGDPLRPRASVLPRGGAAGGASPPAPDRAVRDLGGPERFAGTRTEPAGGPVHRTHTEASGSVAPTTTPASTSAAPGPRLQRRRRRKSFWRTFAMARRAPTATRAAPRSGRTRRWRSQRARSWRRLSRASRFSSRPPTSCTWLERVVADGEERGGDETARLRPGRGPRAPAGLARVGRPRRGVLPEGIVEVMQAKDFTHAAFYRRSRRIHERRLADATEKLTAAATAGEGYGEAATALFDACLPAVPYVPSTAILASEKAKLTAREGEPRRVGLLVDAAGSMHGVTHTIERIREIGVPGLRRRGNRHGRASRPQAAGRGRGRRPVLRRARASAFPASPS